MSSIQSVSFPVGSFTPGRAREWLRRNKLKPIKRVDKTKTKLRYRIENPQMFDKFITKIAKEGVELIIGFSP